MSNNRLAILLSVAAGLTLVSSDAFANGARREARQQLKQDRQIKHDARDKLKADRAAGNQSAIATDKAALASARDKVKADRQALQSIKR